MSDREASDPGFQPIHTPLPYGWRAMPVDRRPVERPSRQVARRDGTTCDPYAGLPDMLAGPADLDDSVRDWTPV